MIVTIEKKVFCWNWGFTNISSHVQIGKGHSHRNKNICNSKDIVKIFSEDELDWISRIFGPRLVLTIHYFLPELDMFQCHDTVFVRFLLLEMRKMWIVEKNQYTFFIRNNVSYLPMIILYSWQNMVVCHTNMNLQKFFTHFSKVFYPPPQCFFHHRTHSIY